MKIKTLEEFSEVLTAAIDKVLLLGQDGKEHCIHLSPEGKELFVVAGEEKDTDLEPMIKAGLCQKGGILVHNHPIPVALSVPDLLLSSQQECLIVCCDSDGGRFSSNGILGSKEKFAAVGEVLDMLNTLSLSFLLEKGWTPTELGMIDSHYLNLMMKKVGILKSYNFLLGAQLKGLMDQSKADFEAMEMTAFAELHHV